MHRNSAKTRRPRAGTRPGLGVQEEQRISGGRSGGGGEHGDKHGRRQQGRVAGAGGAGAGRRGGAGARPLWPPRGGRSLREVPALCPALQTFAASPFSDPFQLDNPDPQPIVDGEEGLIWVIGPVLAVVFIICIVIAILLYKK